MMHTLSGSILTGRDVLHDPAHTNDQEYLDMAQKL